LRITERDIRLLRLIALSHAMTRDQIIREGIFNSVTRVNTRLRQLIGLGLARRLETPFFSQSIYCVTPKSADYLGERVGPLVAGRIGSPRYIQHALMTNETRLEMKRRGMTQWRFEQQLWKTFEFNGRKYQIKPDGLAVLPDKHILVEVDLGHAATKKYAEKLVGFDAFVASGLCKSSWQVETLRVLTLTTSERRCQTLKSLTPKNSRFMHFVLTFEQFNVPLIGAWS
jgi:hypothetical protein